MAVNKKIRVTFFWADEAAAVQDFQAKHTEKLVDWANDFFRKYGMELDVQPDPKGKVADAYKYCLVKSGGYEPDAVSYDELGERYQTARMKEFVVWLRLSIRLGDLKDEEEAKRPQVDAARVAWSALPDGHPDKPAAQTRLDNLLIEYIDITRELASTEPEERKAWKALEAVDQKFNVEFEERNYWRVPRLQLGDKILASFPVSAVTKIKSPGENDYIFSDRRLKVLNARFRRGAIDLRMRGSENPHFGITLTELGFNRFNGRFLWSGPLIMLNLHNYEQITLAHEIVHASGRGHVHPKLKIKPIPDFIKQIQQDSANGPLIVPSIYEFEDDASYRDGPKDDIINYSAKGKSAADVKLYPDDQKAMEEAFFVKEPAP
jgi:hypothetical protein